MSRLTRSSGHVQPMEVVKPAESTRSRRAFGRDITNAAPEPVSSKVVTKPHVFTALNTDLYSAVSESKDDGSKSLFKDPREYMNRSLDDIDSRDAGNPLLCTEYVNDMYQHFHVQEKECLISPIYIKTLQTHVTEKMRTILVDWMVEVHVKFKQVPETLYLTIQLIDRYLQVKCVRRSKLQLVGVACNLLASKYEEIYPPEVRDLVHITDHAYTKSDIVDMENDIANTLSFHLTVPTVHTFLCRCLKAAHADRTMVQMCCYLAERSLQEYSMVGFAPSVLAATTVLIARKSLNRQSPWSPTMLKYSTYDEKDLAACLAAFAAFFETAGPENQQQAVYRKYCSTKYGAVAKMSLTF